MTNLLVRIKAPFAKIGSRLSFSKSSSTQTVPLPSNETTSPNQAASPNEAASMKEAASPPNNAASPNNATSQSLVNANSPAEDAGHSPVPAAQHVQGSSDSPTQDVQRSPMEIEPASASPPEADPRPSVREDAPERPPTRTLREVARTTEPFRSDPNVFESRWDGSGPVPRRTPAAVCRDVLANPKQALCPIRNRPCYTNPKSTVPEDSLEAAEWFQACAVEAVRKFVDETRIRVAAEGVFVINWRLFEKRNRKVRCVVRQRKQRGAMMGRFVECVFLSALQNYSEFRDKVDVLCEARWDVLGRE